MYIHGTSFWGVGCPQIAPVNAPPARAAENVRRSIFRFFLGNRTLDFDFCQSRSYRVSRSIVNTARRDIMKKQQPLMTLASALCLAAIVFDGRAQTTATEILGVVTDSSGSVVAGARITITRVATGQRLERITN